MRDGTLGAAPPGLVGPGTDPLGQPADHLITPELGEQRGASLFHSFSEFGIPAARTATFTGPDPVSGPQSVHQVIGRVTGGSRSAIDGTLRSTIPGADLYLLNPAGVVFGPDASLDLGGSFHATAADHLRLGADGRFSAAAPASDVLSLAPPEAFGFLGSGAGSVEVDGAFLRVPTGETLSLSGGAVSVRSGIVFAPSGRLELAAVDSAGELVPSADDLDASSFETLGLVDVFGATDRSVASVRGGGALFVRGETVVVENAELNLDALSDSDGGGADILARGELRLLDDGRLLGTSDAGGRGGAVRIRAGNVTLRGGSQIRTDASSSGAGGDIAVEATGELLVAGGSGDLSGLFAATGAAATGRGGSIRVRAGTLTLEEGGRIQPFSVGAGDVGDLELEVGSATIRSGAQASTTSFGSGRAGDLALRAREEVVVTGSRDGIDSGLFTSAGPASAGAGALLVSANRLEVSSGADLVATSAGAADAGDISLAAGRLALRDDASLDARSTGTGDGGDVTVIATESVVLSAGFSTIQTNAFPGAGGDVRIEAPGIEIVDLARIRSFGGARGGDIVLTGDRLLLAGSGIETGSEFQAPGAVRIVADDIEIRDSFVLDRAGGDADVAAGEGIRLEGARVRILENSFLDAGGSLSGAPGAPIEITATESILIENASVSSVGEVAGPGGHIAIRSPAVVVSGGLLQVGTNPIFFFVSDGFEVPLSTAASGSIRVEADRLVVANGGSLSSNTNETTGGPVEIEVRELLLESGGAIDAGVTQDFVGNSAIAGPLGGRIAIRAERVSLSGGARITTSATRLPDALDAGAGAVDRVFRAGDVQIQTRNLALASDSSIASTATENDVAGSVRISGADDVRLDRSAITVTAEDGDAGDIAIEASGTVFLDDVSTVTASVTGGDGGNVRIASPDFLILRRGSSVVAQAVQGNGGAIAITASLVFLIDSPPPSASSQFGLDGVVEVNPPDVDLAGTLAVLPAAFADASDLLKDPCSARDPAAASGSFRVALRSGLSSGPDDLLAAPVAFAGRGPGVRPGAGPARPVAGWVGCRAGVW